MLIRLIRNQPKGNAITSRLVINGRYFCNTLERVGYQIPALCYPVRVTQSPKFKRLLPIVQNVPRLPIANSPSPIASRLSPIAYRTGIRFHRGTKPEHSTGCILVPADKELELTNLLEQVQKHEEIILEVTDFRPGTSSE